MTDEQITILKKAVNKYGAENQMDMMVEESAELIQAINKLKRNGGIIKNSSNSEVRKPNFETNTEFSRKYYNLCSEVADCKIMLQQMEIMLDKEAIDLATDRKIEKLKNKLDGKD